MHWDTLPSVGILEAMLEDQETKKTSQLDLSYVQPHHSREQLSTDVSKKIMSHGTSGHPILMQPHDAAVACRQLAVHPRMVQASLLAAALFDLGEPTDLRLSVCRHGLKVNAQSFFQEVLTPALGTMRLEPGNLRVQNAWSQKVIDYGCQSRKDGCIALAKAKVQAMDLSQVVAACVTQSPMQVLPSCGVRVPKKLQESLASAATQPLAADSIKQEVLNNLLGKAFPRAAAKLKLKQKPKQKPQAQRKGKGKGKGATRKQQARAKGKRQRKKTVLKQREKEKASRTEKAKDKDRKEKPDFPMVPQAVGKAGSRETDAARDGALGTQQGFPSPWPNHKQPFTQTVSQAQADGAQQQLEDLAPLQEKARLHPVFDGCATAAAVCMATIDRHILPIAQQFLCAATQAPAAGGCVLFASTSN